MSKNSYPFVLAREWTNTFGPVLTRLASGTFRYAETLSGQQKSRLVWNIYSALDGQKYLVMVLLPRRDDDLVWYSVPLAISEADIAWLPKTDGSSIIIHFYQTRKIWDKFITACLLEQYLQVVTGRPRHVGQVEAMAKDYDAYIDKVSLFLEQHLTAESVSRIPKRRKLLSAVQRWGA